MVTVYKQSSWVNLIEANLVVHSSIPLKLFNLSFLGEIDENGAESDNHQDDLQKVERGRKPGPNQKAGPAR